MAVSDIYNGGGFPFGEGWDASTWPKSQEQIRPTSPQWGAVAAVSVSQCKASNLGPQAKLQKAGANASDFEHTHQFAGHVQRRRQPSFFGLRHRMLGPVLRSYQTPPLL